MLEIVIMGGHPSSFRCCCSVLVSFLFPPTMKNDGDLALDAGRIRERWHTGKKGIVVGGGGCMYPQRCAAERGLCGSQSSTLYRIPAIWEALFPGAEPKTVGGWLVVVVHGGGGKGGRRQPEPVILSRVLHWPSLPSSFESLSAFVGHSDRASLALSSLFVLRLAARNKTKRSPTRW